MPEQIGFSLPKWLYQHSRRSAIIWYLSRKNKHCHHFCPTCKWYYRCQEDVEYEKLMEE